MGRSLVQRSPTEYGVSVCDLEIIQKLCRPLFDDQSSDKGKSVNDTELKGKPIKLALSQTALRS